MIRLLVVLVLACPVGGQYTGAGRCDGVNGTHQCDVYCKKTYGTELIWSECKCGERCQQECICHLSKSATTLFENSVAEAFLRRVLLGQLLWWPSLQSLRWGVPVVSRAMGIRGGKTNLTSTNASKFRSSIYKHASSKSANGCAEKREIDSSILEYRSCRRHRTPTSHSDGKVIRCAVLRKIIYCSFNLGLHCLQCRLSAAQALYAMKVLSAESACTICSVGTF